MPTLLFPARLTGGYRLRAGWRTGVQLQDAYLLLPEPFQDTVNHELSGEGTLARDRPPVQGATPGGASVPGGRLISGGPSIHGRWVLQYVYTTRTETFPMNEQTITRTHRAYLRHSTDAACTCTEFGRDHVAELTRYDALCGEHRNCRLDCPGRPENL